MSVNLSPEQAAWGRFYSELFALGERLKVMMRKKTAASSQVIEAQEEATAVSQLTEVNRPGHLSMLERAGQKAEVS